MIRAICLSKFQLHLPVKHQITLNTILMHCITKCLCGKKYEVFILSTSLLVLNEWLEVGSWNKFNFCNNTIIAQGMHRLVQFKVKISGRFFANDYWKEVCCANNFKWSPFGWLLLIYWIKWKALKKKRIFSCCHSERESALSFLRILNRFLSTYDRNTNAKICLYALTDWGCSKRLCEFIQRFIFCIFYQENWRKARVPENQ